MKKQFACVFLVFSFFLFPLHHISSAADLTLNNTPTQICFSPKGGCTDMIIAHITNAKSEILVHAYSFTSAPIAKALLNAYKRGVKVEATR